MKTKEQTEQLNRVLAVTKEVLSKMEPSNQRTPEQARKYLVERVNENKLINNEIQNIEQFEVSFNTGTRLSLQLRMDFYEFTKSMGREEINHGAFAGIDLGEDFVFHVKQLNPNDLNAINKFLDRKLDFEFKIADDYSFIFEDFDEE